MGWKGAKTICGYSDIEKGYRPVLGSSFENQRTIGKGDASLVQGWHLQGWAENTDGCVLVI